MTKACQSKIKFWATESKHDNIYLIRKLHDLFCMSQSLVIFQSEEVILITIININDCFDLFIHISVFMGEHLFYLEVFI